ncbi:MAG: DUF2279 domain-containing protein [Desulfobacula sp.]|nr:DUF2279 domain-containing protein [Desulfobacula sp.]MCK5347968.1 DUF2279 domain-containing protein [Desulfobacula sp.]
MTVITSCFYKSKRLIQIKGRVKNLSWRFITRYLLSICILLYPLTVSGFDTDFSKEEKVVLTNIAGLAAVTAWGVANWDYFGNSPSRADEGWFSENTKEGGADKLAHFYLSYTLSHALGSLYENWGYSHKKGALLGSWSSFGLMSFMEMGDSFSSYGFSSEDFIMNCIGSIAGYVLYTNPELSRKIDFRVEYIPNFDSVDFFTDYEHSKYLMALKLDGFDCVKKKYLKYLELHVGYYTRGYSNGINKKRNIYVGVGINLSKIFNDLSMKKTSKIANYIQLPYTYLSVKKDLN